MVVTEASLCSWKKERCAAAMAMSDTGYLQTTRPKLISQVQHSMIRSGRGEGGEGGERSHLPLHCNPTHPCRLVWSINSTFKILRYVSRLIGASHSLVQDSLRKGLQGALKTSSRVSTHYPCCKFAARGKMLDDMGFPPLLFLLPCHPTDSQSQTMQKMTRSFISNHSISSVCAR